MIDNRLRNCFQDSRKRLPEELRERIERLPEELRECIERDITETRDDFELICKVKPRVLDRSKPPEYPSAVDAVFYDAIDDREKEILENVLRRLNVDVADIRTLDLGCGSARGGNLALDTVANSTECRKEILKSFASNMHGLELDHDNLKLSTDRLKPKGALPENFHQGNFKEPLPEGLRGGKMHLMWMLMNTMSYNTTERQLEATLKNIDEALAPGGIFLFDTMRLQSLQDMPREDKVRDFSDLGDFHTNLTRMYYAENPPHDKIDRVCRFPVVGSTAVPTDSSQDQTRHPKNGHTLSGEDAMTREVITPAFMEYVLDEMGSPLKMLDGRPFRRRIGPFPDDVSRKIGMRWIAQNGMGAYLKTEIAHRLQQMAKGGEVKPLYDIPFAFVYPGDTKGMGLDAESAEVADIMDTVVAPMMVDSYTKEYCLFEKEA